MEPAGTRGSDGYLEPVRTQSPAGYTDPMGTQRPEWNPESETRIHSYEPTERPEDDYDLIHIPDIRAGPVAPPVHQHPEPVAHEISGSQSPATLESPQGNARRAPEIPSNASLPDPHQPQRPATPEASRNPSPEKPAKPQKPGSSGLRKPGKPTPPKKPPKPGPPSPKKPQSPGPTAPKKSQDPVAPRISPDPGVFDAAEFEPTERPEDDYNLIRVSRMHQLPPHLDPGATLTTGEHGSSQNTEDDYDDVAQIVTTPQTPAPDPERTEGTGVHPVTAAACRNSAIPRPFAWNF